MNGLPVVKLGTTSPVAAASSVGDDETDRFLSSTARLTAAVPFQVLVRRAVPVRPATTGHRRPHSADARRSRATIAGANAGATDIAAARDLLIDHDQMVYVLDDAGRPVLDERRTASASRQRRCSSTASCSSATSSSRSWRCGVQTQPQQVTTAVQQGQPGGSRLSRSPLRRADAGTALHPRRRSGGRFNARCSCPRRSLTCSAGRSSPSTPPTDRSGRGIERSDDGLFNTLGTQAYTCVDHPDTYALAAGTCPAPEAWTIRRRSAPSGSCPLVPTSWCRRLDALLRRSGGRASSLDTGRSPSGRRFHHRGVGPRRLERVDQR